MSATSSVPETRRATGVIGRTPRRGWPVRLALPAVVALIGIGVVAWRLSAAGSATQATTGQVSRATVSDTVTGSGTVQPARQLDLAFPAAGQVAEVLVADGAAVKAGQPLARLDTQELQLQEQQAQASLKSAQAQLAEAQGKGASDTDIKQAQLALQAAQIQLQQVEKGNASAADIRSARANLASAQARLDVLKNPTAASVSAGETKLAQAQASLQNARDSESGAKTKAELALQQATSSLTQAQSRYATAKQNWDFVNETGQDPTNPESKDSSGKTVKNTVNDTQRQQYYDTFVQAEAALRSAEAGVAQAQVSYDNARQSEAVNVPQAEQAVRDAQVQLDALRNPGAQDLTQAQAAVTQAQSQLDKLTSGGTGLDIASAQIQVEQAQLALDRLTAPASASQIASAEAGVAQAQAQLEAAKYDLEHATLTAPFDGVVADVAVIDGQDVGSGAVAVSMVDPTGLHIDMNLSETDVGRVTVGQPVTLTFDALSGAEVQGKVEYVAPTATVQQNVVTYLVRVGFVPGESRVKIGMSATGTVLIEQHPDAIVVPSRAVRTQGSSHVVQVRTAPGQAAVPVRVVTGLTSDGQTEILSCVETGGQCLREGDVVLIQAATTQTTTQNRGGFGFGGPGGPPPGGR